jgi:DNA-binding GntR family transcriptional regulator
VSGPADQADDPGDESRRGKGFRARKREDHALVLIRDLLESLDDVVRVRALLRELGRYYDPVLGGAILEVSHQRAIVEALESGRAEEARDLIQRRYELYVRDRAHLGRGQDG